MNFRSGPWGVQPKPLFVAVGGPASTESRTSPAETIDAVETRVRDAEGGTRPLDHKPAAVDVLFSIGRSRDRTAGTSQKTPATGNAVGTASLSRTPRSCHINLRRNSSTGHPL